ncbi:vacuolar protein sorting-associated protein 36 [Tripterygium wilfordii]|uniref:Vacuolar protein-sorting-associated protein 36 n=1 Tax=Tripterygium wilfordii TaxID=458696 RepID=A0A7J7CHZ5_TRIWF|nr:vacuolar protein sorting-associated protein 36 [Tripterygium wilfordii]
MADFFPKGRAHWRRLADPSPRRVQVLPRLRCLYFGNQSRVEFENCGGHGGDNREGFYGKLWENDTGRSKAKEMVMLAEKKRQKLLLASNSQSSNTSDEEMDSKEEMQDWLLSVGIVSPLKKGVFRSFVSPIIVSTELISPEDLLQACSLWEKFDVFFSRIKTFITRPDALQTGITASDAAMTLGIARATTKEHLLIGDQRFTPKTFYVMIIADFANSAMGEVPAVLPFSFFDLIGHDQTS